MLPVSACSRCLLANKLVVHAMMILLKCDATTEHNDCHFRLAASALILRLCGLDYVLGADRHTSGRRWTTSADLFQSSCVLHLITS